MSPHPQNSPPTRAVYTYINPKALCAYCSTVMPGDICFNCGKLSTVLVATPEDDNCSEAYEGSLMDWTDLYFSDHDKNRKQLRRGRKIERRSDEMRRQHTTRPDIEATKMPMSTPPSTQFDESTADFCYLCVEEEMSYSCLNCDRTLPRGKWSDLGLAAEDQEESFFGLIRKLASMGVLGQNEQALLYKSAKQVAELHEYVSAIKLSSNEDRRESVADSDAFGWQFEEVEELLQAEEMQGMAGINDEDGLHYLGRNLMQQLDSPDDEFFQSDLADDTEEPFDSEISSIVIVETTEDLTISTDHTSISAHSTDSSEALLDESELESNESVFDSEESIKAVLDGFSRFKFPSATSHTAPKADLYEDGEISPLSFERKFDFDAELLLYREFLDMYDYDPRDRSSATLTGTYVECRHVVNGKAYEWEIYL